MNHDMKELSTHKRAIITGFAMMGFSVLGIWKFVELAISLFKWILN